MAESYDVAIVGGGIIGASLLYTLSRFTDINKVILFEKNNRLAQESTNSRNNAQTLHIGDIETNYSIEKVVETKIASELISKYTRILAAQERRRIIKPISKMVLGVGDEEVELIEKRYGQRFLSLFPHIKLLDRNAISKIEPMLVKGRDQNEKITAAYSDTGNMVRFESLAESFAKHALEADGKEIRIMLNEPVRDIQERGSHYTITAKSKTYAADFVVLAAGGYSLYFAKRMGYGNDLSILSVGGNFYYSRKVLNGKVYRVQKGGIPFAAVHGDPDINHPNRTRFGPTVSVLPYLEGSPDIREHPLRSFEDYMSAFGLDKEALASLLNIASNRDILEILAMNAIYSIPDIGKFVFVRDDINRIVPGLRYKDLVIDREASGVRPQIIDKKKRSLILGVVELKADGLIFDMSPSPGASSCLRGALEDTLEIVDYLGKEFHKERFCKAFCSNDRERKLLFRSIRK